MTNAPETMVLDTSFVRTPASQLMIPSGRDIIPLSIFSPPPGRLLLKNKLKGGFFGDSRAANTFSVNALGQNLRTNGWGPAHWIGLLTNGLVECPNELDFGISGQTTEQILQRVGQPAASDADIVMCYGGINDNPFNFGGTIQNIIAICQALSQAGKVVFYSAEYPLNTLSGETANALMYLRHQILRLRIPNVYPVDFWPVCANNNNSNVAWDALGSYDGEHPNPTGALASMTIVAQYIAALSPAQALTIPVGGDAYNGAINASTGLPINPAGNLLGNGRLSGTGGTTSGAGTITGTAPTDWVLSADAGWTVAATQITDTNLIWESLVVTGTPTANANVVQLEQAITTANLLPGDTIQLSCQIQVSAGATAIYGPVLEILAGGVPIVSDGYLDITATNGSGSNFGTCPITAFGGTMRTQWYTVPAVPVALTARIVVKGAVTVASNITFQVAAFEMKKTTSGGLPV